MEAEWGSLAPELLALVIQKVRDGAGGRREGRRMVALAGVCRAWRCSVHQSLRGRPQSLLIFPASTHHPAPSHLQCLLKKTGNVFRLMQQVAGEDHFLLGARKRISLGSSWFRIGTDPRVLWTHGRGEAMHLTSNFWRTAFALPESFSPTTIPKTILSLKFEEVVVDGNCLRRIRCQKREASVRSRDSSWWSLLNWSSREKYAASSSLQSADKRLGMFELRSRDPDWHEQKRCWSLDFGGRGAIVPSVHNFQLVSGDDGVVLQLGKLCKGVFVLDFRSPLSPVEAFAIALCSFVTSVALDA